MNITVLSGGLDSTVALATTNPRPDDLALSFTYGQTHSSRELDAARTIATHYGIRHRIIDLHGIFTGSALTGDQPIPDGDYDAETMSATVVHGRNMLFASLAVALAGDGGRVTVGVHGGDHHLYPDCRPDFWNSYTDLTLATYGTRIHTPLLHHTKADIVQRGVELGAPLARTWSCYRGGDLHCGTCGTCVERRQAFTLAGVDDPTRYQPE